MNDYTIEFKNEDLLVRDNLTSRVVHKLHFSIEYTADEIMFEPNNQYTCKPEIFINVNNINWKTSGWSIRNCICEDSQVYAIISSKTDANNNLCVVLKVEAGGYLMSSFELIYTDYFAEFIEKLKTECIVSANNEQSDRDTDDEEEDDDDL